MKVHYPKLYNMAHLLALNGLLLPKDLTIIFIQWRKCLNIFEINMYIAPGRRRCSCDLGGPICFRPCHKIGQGRYRVMNYICLYEL